MPTPFNHLLAARDLLRSPELPASVRQALAAEEPAFLLGNIAPDVQTVTGQTREATHFFPVPIGQAPPAHVCLFAEYAALSRPADLSRAQAAFLAGYLAHLELDQVWVAEIFAPVFGPDQSWGTFGERLYLHNALRAHWDALDLPELPLGTGERLRRAEPASWLPFVGDQDLRRWRDLVADQLRPGAPARTVEVFAERMGADPEAFARLLASPDEMQRRVFIYVSPQKLEQYRALSLLRSAEVIARYWEARLA